MSRLTLRLPDSLHRELESRAENEQVSLNQYLVYSLTRQVSMGYSVSPLPEGAVEQQKIAFEALLQRLGRASSEEIQQVLSDRELAVPEPGLDPALVARLRRQITAASAA